MTIYLGSQGSSYWRAALEISSITSSNTETTVRFRQGIYLSKELHKDHGYYTGRDTSYVTFNGTKSSVQGTRDLNRGNTNQNDYIWYGSGYRELKATRGTSAKTLAFYAYNSHDSGYNGYEAKSTLTVNVTVPALAKYTMTFNGNGSGATNVPSAITHYYGGSATLPATKPTRGGYAFKYWTTQAGGGGTIMYPSSKWTGNANVTMYAQWGVTNPPSFKATVTCIADSAETKSFISGFGDLEVKIYDVELYGTRSIASNGVVIYVKDKDGNTVATLTKSAAGTYTIQQSSLSALTDGELSVVVSIKDNADGGGAVTEKIVATKNIVQPTWSQTITVTGDLPKLDQNGNAILDSLQIYDYSLSGYVYVSTSGITPKDVTSTTWSFDYTFGVNYVDDSTSLTPTVKVKVDYRYFTGEVGQSRSAFFATSRNQNYSNGIYNQVFVSGCDNTIYPEYTSRVWWCKINNPLYFPDTNYIEVGSNDTAVQGLTKVGDYLGVVKQSKTTDTAIYLLYPTSFEEETTFAVKQGVQGVGALARYSFNILGDETLFLSPHGVMAIVPTQDEEHKVQNRSYFIDGKMLKDPEIANSYSFVHDGKYYLSIGNAEGSVYVLDGNQRNSWGNDKTNLVYECYYLKNVPAKCFVKYNDKLAFSTSDEVCIIGDDFVDAYDNITGDENAPVKAEWSTIFDDDGALHYYKTMQKKGNLVSILPLDNPSSYKKAVVSEDQFNADKTIYFELVDGKYVRCTENSVYETDDYKAVQISEDEFNANKTSYYKDLWAYDGLTNTTTHLYINCLPTDSYSLSTTYYTRTDHAYYIEYINATKVYVRKDDKEPVEITRSFGISSEIPSELFINKKFKKYKRLQFILRNEEAEDFGVDEIVKNYTVGNYAKR